jgi:hypothetical protein
VRADTCRANMDSLAAVLRQRATGAMVVVTTGAASSSGVDRLVGGTGGYGWVALVLVGSEADAAHGNGGNGGAGGAGGTTSRRGRIGTRSAAAITVAVPPGRPFGEAWNAALAGNPRRATTVRR